jgi:hypothetical protein
MRVRSVLIADENFKSNFKLLKDKIRMKFNISYPLTGAQKTVEVDDDKKCAVFFDKRMGA